jgi:hypothetical protein
VREELNQTSEDEEVSVCAEHDAFDNDWYCGMSRGTTKAELIAMSGQGWRTVAASEGN